MKAHLKHGWGSPVEYLPDGGIKTAPRSHERVPVKIKDAPTYRSATGYGTRIPTEYMVKWRGKWRRVYAICVSNAGSLYVRDGKTKIFF